VALNCVKRLLIAQTTSGLHQEQLADLRMNNNDVARNARFERDRRWLTFFFQNYRETGLHHQLKDHEGLWGNLKLPFAPHPEQVAGPDGRLLPLVEKFRSARLGELRTDPESLSSERVDYNAIREELELKHEQFALRFIKFLGVGVSTY
jgi:hypothetical protein